jgi:hypothetical protein
MLTAGTKQIGPYFLNENVGKTILKQISTMDKWALGAWGAMGQGRMVTFNAGDAVENVISNMMPGYKILDDNSNAQIKRLVGSNRGGVVLKVNGSKLRNGFVIIALTGADLYKIIAGQTRKVGAATSAWNHKKDINGVYADMLIDVLNDIIG